ncbi:regulator of chromosome condensation 1/beta-lactamase-inhibitor protein II [Pavlovales sp. CCMP2436]|nr:regulator of chromosome condensation 1/beta-lactamase-inhibitor protein II [Pavlovales sp. CCMP2436]
MYKSAYELGGDARATAVLRRYFLEQKKEAEGAEGAAEGAAGAPAAAGSSSAAPEARPIAVAPPVPAAVAPIASVAPIAPKPLVERTPGQLLIAGSAAWEDVGKKTLSPEEALILHTFHRALVGTPIALIATGPSACHVFALTPTGTAFAWGRNSNGQLGLGHTNPTSSPSPLKQLSTDKTDSKIVAIACGKAHTLFVTGKGKLFACGSNASAQLGIGTGAKTGSYVDAPKAVKWPAGREACRVACGADFSVATDSEGHLYSWGHPQCGQLGHGSTGECLEKSGRVDYDFRCGPLAPTALALALALALAPLRNNLINDNNASANHINMYSSYYNNASANHINTYSSNYNNASANHINTYSSYYNNASANHINTYSSSHILMNVIAGATFFWGRTKSTGEATMYPKAVADLHGWSTRSFACGHTSSFVAADRSLIAWGPSPTYGELGYGPEGPKSSTTPKLVDDLTGALVEQVTSFFFSFLLLCSFFFLLHSKYKLVNWWSRSLFFSFFSFLFLWGGGAPVEQLSANQNPYLGSSPALLHAVPGLSPNLRTNSFPSPTPVLPPTPRRALLLTPAPSEHPSPSP